MEVARDSRSLLIKGEVLAIGPKVRAEIVVGECVLFTQACKDPVRAAFGAETDLMLIRDGDLAGILPATSTATDGRSEDL